MIRAKSIPLLELAEIASAAFEEYPHDNPADRRGGRLFRSVLIAKLQERFGDDWKRAWNHLAQRQSCRSDSR